MAQFPYKTDWKLNLLSMLLGAKTHLYIEHVSHFVEATILENFLWLELPIVSSPTQKIPFGHSILFFFNYF
jgi:hypothetical protein